MFTQNITTGILSHKWESLNHLWSIVMLAYKMLPADLQAPLGEESRRALYFKEIESKIFISVSIKSTAVHNLHISEWCWCKDDEVKMTLGATSPDTNITGESTGNGVANDGYLTYQDAVTGDNEYRYLFLPWFIQREYQLPLKEIEPDSIMKHLKEDEKRVQRIMLDDYKMVLTPEQVLWRRQTKRAQKDLFPQEFPETAEDAFVSSGKHFFAVKKILELLKDARAWNKANTPDTDERFIEYEKPNKNDVYVAGADTSEGVNDNCTLKIINVTKRRHAFKYRGKVGIKTFYNVCNEWCRTYNNALLAVERNNTGHAVILGLDEICRYRNLFYETQSTRAKMKMSDKPKIKLGWDTNKLSRTKMLIDLKQAIEGDEEDDIDTFQPMYSIYDEDMLKELLTFINNDGKYEASEGKLDDEVIAEAIANQMFMLKYRTSRKIVNKGGKIFVSDKRESATLF
ncbi:MAG TPA: hypothetical protein ENH87_11070 [Pricia antarctica]|uniref:Terminase-like family protein n=1 Tax=Pricia antarctica TaxID=641691 RepID=A0A831QNJ5_9FLAO|nr:hypothetical protein [Pricia antarctica]